MSAFDFLRAGSAPASWQPWLRFSTAPRQFRPNNAEVVLLPEIMSPRLRKRSVGIALEPSPVGGDRSGQAGGRMLFDGLHFVFGVKVHMRHMMKRVEELGGLVQDKPGEGTTYIVCSSDAEESDVLKKLGLQPSAKQRVQFVVPEFVSTSILRGQLQQEEAFRPEFVQRRGGRRRAADVQEKVGSSDGEAHEHARKRFKPSGATAEGIPDIQPTVLPQELEPAAAPQLQQRSADSSSAAAGSEGDPCVVERHGAEWVAVTGMKPCHTGGHTGTPWGTCGVWDEPYHEAAARATVEKLRRFWYREHPTAASAATGGAAEPSARQTNGVCTHTACALRPFCIVERLKEVRAAYVKGRDQFRLKALDRAMRQVAEHTLPLDSDADVDFVGLGAKSAEKVKEILRMGHANKAQAAMKDERQRAYVEFVKVWGVGAGVAERWYNAGCSTLDDVRAQVAEGSLRLTEEQQVGLRYLDEFSRKIPRSETARAEAIVREATFDVTEGLGATDAEMTYVFATGSYCRGSPESGDIDILICLPPSLTAVHCGNFLRRLLTLLLERGLLLDEMGPTQQHAHASSERASWLGVCRPPGALGVRRIDFKIYSAPCAPYAVSYFASSQAFCRAMRLWANDAVPEVARRYHAAATGLKISDIDVVPIAKGSGKHGRQAGQRSGAEGGHISVVGPPVRCANETEIFELLGLSYVPPAMRYFHDYF